MEDEQESPLEDEEESPLGDLEVEEERIKSALHVRMVYC
jgi:hypothetical protein